MTRRRVSNPLALAVLGLLLERPMHPYEMSRTLRERNKEGSIRLNYGSLYSVVDKLLGHGLIETQETVREGRRPERTVYRATSAGRAEFEDWLAELLSSHVKEYSQFEAGLSLMPALPPDEVVPLLEQRCRLLEHSLASLDAIQRTGGADLPRLFWIEWDYVRAHTETDLSWTRQLLADIRDGSFEGLDLWQRFHTEGSMPDDLGLAGGTTGAGRTHPGNESTGGTSSRSTSTSSGDAHSTGEPASSTDKHSTDSASETTRRTSETTRRTSGKKGGLRSV